MIPAFFKMVFQLRFMGAAPFSENGAVSRYAAVLSTDGWIGIDEAAKYMDVTKDTVRNWIKKTDIPAHKIGKLWKFKRSELDSWIKSGKSAID